MEEYVEILYDRWAQTMYHVRRIILDEVILNGNRCLNIAIERCWSNFVPESPRLLAPLTCDWLETMLA